MLVSWIKLHRQFTDWEWYSHGPTKIVFIELLLTANIKEKKFRGEVVPIGSTVSGRKALSLKLGLSEQQVRTALNNLQSTNEITIKSNSQFSIISIVSWDIYQRDNRDSNQQSTNEQPTINQQSTTPKELNNNIYNPPIVPPQKINSIEEIENHPLDGKFLAYFEEKCPNVDILELRDDLVQYCKSQGKTYKDYWATLQTWGRRRQAEINEKPLREGKTHENFSRKPTKLEQKQSALDEAESILRRKYGLDEPSENYAIERAN